MGVNTINYPVFRLGKVLHADTPITDDRARTVAQAILSEKQDFISGILECFRSQGARRIRSAPEDVFLHDDDTPIIDFPLFHLSIGEYCCRSRASLTVCKLGQRSKIWTRMTLVRYRSKIAFGLSPRQTQDFFTRVEDILTCLTQKIYERYVSVLQDQGVARSVEPGYSFRLTGINSHNPNLQHFLTELTQKDISGLDRLDENKGYFESLSPFLRLVFGKDETGLESLRRLMNSDKWWMSILEGAVKNTNINTIFIVHNTPKQTYIDSICYNARRDLRVRKPVELATQEILKYYAEQYCFDNAANEEVSP